MPPKPAPERGQARIVATDVTKLIDDQVLLGPTSLTAHAGECLAVLGENGAGKTTLLRVITGAYLPTEGEVRLDGERVDATAPARVTPHTTSTLRCWWPASSCSRCCVPS